MQQNALKSVEKEKGSEGQCPYALLNPALNLITLRQTVCVSTKLKYKITPPPAPSETSQCLGR